MDFILVINDQVPFSTPEETENTVNHIYRLLVAHSGTVFLQRHSINVSLNKEEFGGDTDVEFDLVLARAQSETKGLQIFQVNYLYKSLK